MNRCTSATGASAMTRLRHWAAPTALLAALGLAHLGLSAQVASRPFPPNAVRGVLTVTQPPEVLMNGRPDRLSPGSRIRDTNNMLVLSGALVGQPVRVNYVREPNGSIHEVWILTDGEARQPAPGQR